MLLPTLLFATLPVSLALNYPPLPGNKKVGVTPLELKLTYPDPITPSAGPRDLMLSIYCPSKSSSTFAPAFDPAYARYLSSSLGIPLGFIKTVTSNAYQNSTYNDNNPKEVLLFSGGYGQGREDYGATISNLASYGYIIISVDHPFDSSFISYPDRHNATLVPSQPSDPVAAATRAINIRVQDLLAVTDALQNKTFTKQIPGVTGKLDKPTGILGHSFGGATAASFMARGKNIKCGVNLDGTFWGDVPSISSAISPRAFLTLASEGHNATTDPSWVAFATGGGKKANLGFLGVSGSSHAAYTDFGYLCGIAGCGNGLFGTIDGSRMLEVEGVVLKQFFGGCFGGDKDVFKGLGKGFGEVFAQ